MKICFILKATQFYNWVCDSLFVLTVYLLLCLNLPQCAQAMPPNWPGEVREADYIPLAQSEKNFYPENLDLVETATVIAKSMGPGTSAAAAAAALWALNCGFKGELETILINHSHKPFKVNFKECISQLGICPVCGISNLTEPVKLRGVNKLGSTVTVAERSVGSFTLLKKLIQNSNLVLVEFLNKEGLIKDQVTVSKKELELLLKNLKYLALSLCVLEDDVAQRLLMVEEELNKCQKKND